MFTVYKLSSTSNIKKKNMPKLILAHPGILTIEFGKETYISHYIDSIDTYWLASKKESNRIMRIYG